MGLVLLQKLLLEWGLLILVAENLNCDSNNLTLILLS